MPVVLYVLGKLDIGGAELRSLQFFAAIKNQYPTLSIVVYVTSPDPGALNQRFLDAGVRIVQGEAGIRALPGFWKLCRRERPTLLHANVGTTSGYFALAALFAGIPRRICHYRSTNEGRTRPYQRFKVLVGIIMIRLFATRVVGVCSSARAFARIPERDWRTVYNGVVADDPARIGARPPGNKKLIVLGRIAPGKNCVRAVGMFEALARRVDGAGAELHFVGTGAPQDLALLEQRIAISPAAASIHLHGASHEPLRHLRAADLLVLTSLREGLPGVILEALSVGTPVVASDLPGIREIAARVEGVTLVSPEAGDSAWAEAAAEALVGDRRVSILRSFLRSPFVFESYVERMGALWGLSAKPVAAGQAVSLFA